MKIKRKIRSGFVIIAAILLLSSLIAIYEFITMRNNISQLVLINVSSINISDSLQDVCDEYAVNLLESLNDEYKPAIPNVAEDTRFLDQLRNLQGIANNPRELEVADTVKSAFVAYVHMMAQAPHVWLGHYEDRREWYFKSFYPSYVRLGKYIRKLSSTSQELLSENSINLSESFYRSIMPCIVAVCSGIVLIFLFNYFVNYYILTPLIKIGRGISLYLKAGKRYDLKLENDDELAELNDNVAQLIDSNRQLQKQ